MPEAEHARERSRTGRRSGSRGRACAGARAAVSARPPPVPARRSASSAPDSTGEPSVDRFQRQPTASTNRVPAGVMRAKLLLSSNRPSVQRSGGRSAKYAAFAAPLTRTCHCSAGSEKRSRRCRAAIRSARLRSGRERVDVERQERLGQEIASPRSPAGVTASSGAARAPPGSRRGSARQTACPAALIAGAERIVTTSNRSCSAMNAFVDAVSCLVTATPASPRPPPPRQTERQQQREHSAAQQPLHLSRLPSPVSRSVPNPPA